MKLDKKRILKNSTALYLRMAVLTVITLYTSRIVLEELGVESFGIYNIVGGVVVVFSFLNSALISSTQRFINFEAEKGDGNIGHIFSMCVNIHIVLAVVILLLSETIGLFILNNYINIPPEKIDAANWVFQFSLGLFIINILRAPYEAVIVANEEMSFFAYLSIFEGLLRLGIAFALAIFGGNKLVFYAIMLFVAAVLVFFCYYLYVRLSFPCAKYKFCADRQLFKRIMGFSIWSLMGEASNMLNSQGIAFVVNILCGVTVNAAMGLAEQINGAVARFVSNFQIAFSPQIVKLYAARNYGDLHSIIYLATKISFYLSLVIGLPLVVNVKYVLGIWLKSYPEYTEGLVVAILCYLFVTVLNAPLWTAIKATGNIRTYQIIISQIGRAHV